MGYPRVRLNSMQALRLLNAARFGGVRDAYHSDFTNAAAWCRELEQPEIAARLEAIARVIEAADGMLVEMKHELRAIEHVKNNGGGAAELARWMVKL